jgi:hypothetical protein
LRPFTQVVVDIDADDVVRERAARVRLIVAGAPTEAELPEAAPSIQRTITLRSPGGPYWPLREVMEPRNLDTERRFLVSVTARTADDDFVAEVRVLSGYVSGEVRYIRLRLEASCIAVECGATETCANGHCEDAWREPGSLPLFKSDGPRAGFSGGSDGDAGPNTNDDASGADVSKGGCSNDHGGCDVLVSCQVANRAVVCGTCPPGYDDVHGDGTACRDRDECLIDNGGCDSQHGRCTNTAGRYECRCEEGFHGDGKHCSGNVPCQDDSACTEHASCKELDGRRSCVCKAGYEGNGASCADSDECARKLDDCDRMPNACSNDAGGYHCQCPAGYTGDGRGEAGCVGINECTAGTDDCSDVPDACVDTGSGFNCQCPTGYSGTGRGPAGCVDVDECAANTDTCASTPEACVNDAPGFHCQCPPGFTGTGQGVAGCADVDECLTSNGGCDLHRACLNTLGGVQCGVCAAGYGVTGASGCSLCACYQTGGQGECSSRTESVPIAATAPLGGNRVVTALTMVGFQVDLPENAHASSFGVFKQGAGRAGEVMLGLYSNVNGQPSVRLAHTESTAFTGNQVRLPAVSDDEGSGCLPAGTYWLVAVSNANVNYGEANAGGVRSVTLGVLRTSATLPARWPVGSTFSTAPQLNLFVTFDHP